MFINYIYHYNSVTIIPYMGTRWQHYGFTRTLDSLSNKLLLSKTHGKGHFNSSLVEEPLKPMKLNCTLEYNISYHGNDSAEAEIGYNWQIVFVEVVIIRVFIHCVYDVAVTVRITGRQWMGLLFLEAASWVCFVFLSDAMWEQRHIKFYDV